VRSQWRRPAQPRDARVHEHCVWHPGRPRVWEHGGTRHIIDSIRSEVDACVIDHGFESSFSSSSPLSTHTYPSFFPLLLSFSLFLCLPLFLPLLFVFVLFFLALCFLMTSFFTPPPPPPLSPLLLFCLYFLGRAFLPHSGKYSRRVVVVPSPTCKILRRGPSVLRSHVVESNWWMCRKWVT
jgi:hypothetical protein